MKHTKNCIECGVKLDSPTNWWPSFVGKQHYKCIDCYDTRRAENKIKKMYSQGKQPSPKLLARFLGNKHKAEYNKIKQGFVYVISNPAWENWVKIGMAVDADDRIINYQTSSPFRDYDLKYSQKFNDRRSAETEVHSLLGKEYTRNNEWFECSVEEAIEAIEGVSNETY